MLKEKAGVIALLQGHQVFLCKHYPKRIFCIFKAERSCVSFVVPGSAARRKRPLVFRALPTKTFAAP